MLKGRKIILAVTGSIAAYKAAFLTRLLKQQGAEVKIIMTHSAVDFITPLTLSTLSGNKVLIDFIADKRSGEWNNHVELGLWADVMVVAPASANTIAKMANGICDNLVLATYLSLRCPVIVAPAMDLDMWKHASTQKNITTLLSNGAEIIQPEKGELASGLFGQGRMAEPEHIVSYLQNFFLKSQKLKGKKVVITAGPTHEAIDPVRFIGNSSSGKMGIALAEQALKMGAEVTLICGPSSIASSSAIHRINVVSALEMLTACKKVAASAQIIIMSAAVADYRPKKIDTKKIKKSETQLNLELEPTDDILKYLGTKKSTKQILVGFALETNNEIENAKQKLKNKKLDFIVLNSLQDKGAGFGHDTNKITILDKRNKLLKFELKSKEEAAKDILNAITSTLK